MSGKISKGRAYCIASAVIIFGSYIMERVLSIAFEPTKVLVIAEAFVYTALVALVYFFVVNSKDCFYGILMSIFAVRMMPPNIQDLAELAPEAEIVYYIAQKFAQVIFIVAIIRLYEQQQKPRLIKPIPIICTIIVVPFVTEIQLKVGPFLSAATGTMLYTFFSFFALYTAAMLVLLFVASRTSKLGAQLICDFQILALGMNAARRLMAIIINVMITHNHISRSYYCWVAIYVFFIIAFAVMKNRRKTNIV